MSISNVARASKFAYNDKLNFIALACIVWTLCDMVEQTVRLHHNVYVLLLFSASKKS